MPTPRKPTIVQADALAAVGVVLALAGGFGARVGTARVGVFLGGVALVLAGVVAIGASQRLRHRTDERRAEVQRMTSQRLVIRSSLDTATLQDAVVRGLGLPYEKPTAVHAELFQGPIRPGHVQFCSGTTAMTAFTAGMRLAANPDGGCTLTYQVERWTSADGVVAGFPQLRFLRRRVEEEARTADTHAVVTVEATPDRVRR